jgi:hypothetical protein
MKFSLSRLLIVLVTTAGLATMCGADASIQMTTTVLGFSVMADPFLTAEPADNVVAMADPFLVSVDPFAPCPACGKLNWKAYEWNGSTRYFLFRGTTQIGGTNNKGRYFALKANGEFELCLPGTKGECNCSGEGGCEPGCPCNGDCDCGNCQCVVREFKAVQAAQQAVRCGSGG